MFLRWFAVATLLLIGWNIVVAASLGHNGAGKSTIFSMISGINAPTKGRILSESIADRQKQIGFYPQYNPIFPKLTVNEHLSFFARLKDCEKGDKTGQKVLFSLLGMAESGTVWASNLSGGMKRKLCMAISMAANSPIVLLDEPTAGLDPGARRNFEKLLLEWKKEHTILLTTHYTDEAELLADRIFIMAKGKVFYSGSAQFLRKKFDSGFVLLFALKGDAEIETATTEIVKIVKEFVPDASLYKSRGKQFELNLTDDSGRFVEMFRKIEEVGPSMGMQSYGLSMNKLEQVFLEVGEMNGTVDRKEEVETALKELIEENDKRVEGPAKWHFDCAAGLSGGMKRKLCIVMAADWPIALLDDPTAGLDPGARRDFDKLLSLALAASFVMIVCRRRWILVAVLCLYLLGVAAAAEDDRKGGRGGRKLDPPTEPPKKKTRCNEDAPPSTPARGNVPSYLRQTAASAAKTTQVHARVFAELHVAFLAGEGRVANGTRLKRKIPEKAPPLTMTQMKKDLQIIREDSVRSSATPGSSTSSARRRLQFVNSCAEDDEHLELHRDGDDYCVTTMAYETAVTQRSRASFDIHSEEEHMRVLDEDNAFMAHSPQGEPATVTPPHDSILIPPRAGDDALQSILLRPADRAARPEFARRGRLFPMGNVSVLTASGAQAGRQSIESSGTAEAADRAKDEVDGGKKKKKRRKRRDAEMPDIYADVIRRYNEISARPLSHWSLDRLTALTLREIELDGLRRQVPYPIDAPAQRARAPTGQPTASSSTAVVAPSATVLPVSSTTVAPSTVEVPATITTVRTAVQGMSSTNQVEPMTRPQDWRELPLVIYRRPQSGHQPTSANELGSEEGGEQPLPNPSAGLAEQVLHAFATIVRQQAEQLKLIEDLQRAERVERQNPVNSQSTRVADASAMESERSDQPHQCSEPTSRPSESATRTGVDRRGPSADRSEAGAARLPADAAGTGRTPSAARTTGRRTEIEQLAHLARELTPGSISSGRIARFQGQMRRALEEMTGRSFPTCRTVSGSVVGCYLMSKNGKPGDVEWIKAHGSRNVMDCHTSRVDGDLVIVLQVDSESIGMGLIESHLPVTSSHRQLTLAFPPEGKQLRVFNQQLLITVNPLPRMKADSLPYATLSVLIEHLTPLLSDFIEQVLKLLGATVVAADSACNAIRANFIEPARLFVTVQVFNECFLGGVMLAVRKA